MSSSKSVNVGGTIRALQSLGFHLLDLPPEGFDNSLGVKATHIRMMIEEDHTCIFADNGPGMNREQLEERFVLYDDKPASDERQGRFGIGEDVKHSLLTENLKMSKTITKGRCPPKSNPQGAPVLRLSQIELDWPRAIEKNVFPLHASDASRESEEEWNKYAIDPKKSGTVDIIPLSDANFKYFTENAAAVVQHYERMYAKDLLEGLRLQLVILNHVYTLQGHDVLVEQHEPQTTFTKSQELDVYQAPDGSLIIYFKNTKGNKISKGKWVRRDGNARPEKPDVLDPSWKHLGLLPVEHAYHRNWQKLYDLGGIYYNRNRKNIMRKSLVSPNSGDYDLRDVIVSGRTRVTFPVAFDKFFGLEVNKSHIKNIHKELEEEIEWHAMQFRKDAWRTLHPPKEVAPAPAPAPAAAEVGRTATTLDTLITIKSKKAANPVVVPVVEALPPPPSQPAMSRQEFQAQYIDELKKVHPDWPHRKAFSEAGHLWTEYKKTGVRPNLAVPVPTTTITPLPEPAPVHSITFSKNVAENCLTVTDGQQVLGKLPIVGQPHIWETICKQTLEAVGPARFKEWLGQMILVNTNFLK